jgi:hypothetical protein
VNEDPTVEDLEDPFAEAPAEIEDEDPFGDEPAEETVEEAEHETLEAAQPETLEVVEAPAARRLPSDEEIQEQVSKIALGLRVQVRSTVGEVTDTFIVGGDYAPGRSRWVQTPA